MAGYVRGIKLFSDTPLGLKKTPLFNLHSTLNAKFGPFAGWKMPLSYGTESLISSVKHCRTSASIFDVSHMQCVSFSNDPKSPNSKQFLFNLLETIMISDATKMKIGNGSLTMFTNLTGGIIDDAILTKKVEDENFAEFLLVTNAGRSDVVWKLIQDHHAQNPSLYIKKLTDNALLAIQGI